MRKLTLATVLASALLIVSNIASAAIVHTEDTGYYWEVEGAPTKISVTVNRINAGGWQYGLYSLDTGWKTDSLENGRYTFDVSETGTKIGVWAKNGNGNQVKHLVYSDANIAGNNGFSFSLTDPNSATFSFGKQHVMGEVTFGSPLPTPVVTLLIALGLGAAFVMYRSRKQQAEA